MRHMTGDDFSRAILLGEQVSPNDLKIIGDVVIEGLNEKSRLFLEDLNLDRVHIDGCVQIRNVVFSGYVSFWLTTMNGTAFIFENIKIDGNYSEMGGLLKMVKSGCNVRVANISFSGEQQFN